MKRLLIVVAAFLTCTTLALTMAAIWTSPQTVSWKFGYSAFAIGTATVVAGLWLLGFIENER